MSQSDSPQAKKILIDEDWKSQVQAEKEAAQKAPAEPPPAPQRAPYTGPIPAPTLTLLATSFGMQAMISMGLVPDPTGKSASVDMAQARHLIDTIELLHTKTEGNRTEDESFMFDDLLHQLRLAFVAAQSGAKAEG